MNKDENLDHARDFGNFINYSPLKVEWIRSEPWAPWWPASSWQIDIWEYTANRRFPMTMILAKEFVMESGLKLPAGTHIQPDRHFVTDFGSIPPCLNGWPSLTRTRFLGPFLIHDSSCRFGVLWVLFPGDGIYKSIIFTRKDGDQLLRIMVGASPWNGNAWQRTIIYDGVRIGARFRARTDSKPGLPPPPIPKVTATERKATDARDGQEPAIIEKLKISVDKSV